MATEYVIKIEGVLHTHERCMPEKVVVHADSSQPHKNAYTIADTSNRNGRSVLSYTQKNCKHKSVHISQLLVAEICFDACLIGIAQSSVATRNGMHNKRQLHQAVH